MSDAKSLNLERASLIVLIALSAVGIGITNFAPIKSFWFWAAMPLIFGATSLYIGWRKARLRGECLSRIIKLQLLHWASLLAVIVLTYSLYETTGRINNNELALVTLFSLAITTFLAGVHFDSRFLIVGVILGAALAGAAFIEQFFWIIIFPIVAAAGLIIFWQKRQT